MWQRLLMNCVVQGLSTWGSLASDPWCIQVTLQPQPVSSLGSPVYSSHIFSVRGGGLSEWWMHNVHTATLMTITGSVSLSQPGLELILLVGGTFTDALSQTDHNCFFIKVARCSRKKMTNRREEKKKQKRAILLFTSPTRKNTYFRCVPISSGLSNKPPSGTVS